MNCANILTIIRIILVPIFVVILLTEMENKEILALLIFLLASVTDSLDGYIARKYNQVTDLGKFLDPLADKLLVAGALIALVYLQMIETWIAAVIIIREIFITAFRFYTLVNDNVFAASWLAKKKTIFQVLSVGVLIFALRFPRGSIEFDRFYFSGTILLYFAVFLTVYSGVEYLIKYSKTLNNND